jgi:hypothetical protein
MALRDSKMASAPAEPVGQRSNGATRVKPSTRSNDAFLLAFSGCKLCSTRRANMVFGNRWHDTAIKQPLEARDDCALKICRILPQAEHKRL